VSDVAGSCRCRCSCGCGVSCSSVEGSARKSVSCGSNAAPPSAQQSSPVLSRSHCKPAMAVLVMSVRRVAVVVSVVALFRCVVRNASAHASRSVWPAAVSLSCAADNARNDRSANGPRRWRRQVYKEAAVLYQTSVVKEGGRAARCAAQWPW
jgi:hypothetical protein